MALEVSARVGGLILDAARAAGAAAPALAAAAGFDPSLVADPDARVDVSIIEALWEQAATATADPAFGLHAAEQLRPGMMDVLDYAVRTAPTVRVALERLARYDRLVRDAGELTIGEVAAADGGGARIAYADRPGAPTSRHATECKLAALLVLGRQLTGRALVARSVQLRHPAPADLAEHARVFGVAPRFGALVDAIELADDALDAPCLTADPALWRIIERHADELLAQRPGPPRTASRVRQLLGPMLADGGATLAAAARELHMSERSLQRRLADEGTTFEAILDELRHELARRYLRDPKIAIGEVAYLLGYSEPSAFHRAFKRWTGATPAEARREHGGARAGT